MGVDRAELHRQRARELRAIAHFVDEPRKQGTLRWLARDEDHIAEEGSASGMAALVRQLHLLDIAEQLAG